MVFLPSSYPLDALLKSVSEHDFGILVLSPDDVSKIRGTTAVVPRGNVLFEKRRFSWESTVETGAFSCNRATTPRLRFRQISMVLSPRRTTRITIGVIRLRLSEPRALRSEPRLRILLHSTEQLRWFRRSNSLIRQLAVLNYPKKLAFRIYELDHFACTAYLARVRNGRAIERPSKSIERLS